MHLPVLLHIHFTIFRYKPTILKYCFFFQFQNELNKKHVFAFKDSEQIRKQFFCLTKKADYRTNTLRILLIMYYLLPAA